MSSIVVVGTLSSYMFNMRGEFLKALIQSGHKVTALVEDNQPFYIDSLKDLGVDVVFYPIRRNRLNPLDDLRTFFSLKKIFSNLNPDIVLAYTIKPVIWCGFALYYNCQTRFYALITGLGFAFQTVGVGRKALSAFVSHLYKLSLSRSSKVIFQNPDNLDLFVNKKIVSCEKCRLVNGSGVDLLRFSVSSFPKHGNVFLTIGRLLGEKGFREYAQAARLVKCRYPEAEFRLVGPTDPSPDGISSKEVARWRADGIVKYLGKSTDVRPHLADCHVYVLPSYHEGLPRTVLEAMAMGRPILTTNVPGCRETVIPGENGWMVPKADAEALAERMIWFIEHREEWQRMGAKSRELTEERFDVHKVNLELLRIMDLAI